MRILFDYTMFAIQRYGGVSRYFVELLPRLADFADVKVSLMMGLHISRYGLETQRQKFERFAALRRPFIRGTHGLAQRMNAWWFKRFAIDLEFDIYHTTYYFEGDPRPGVRKRVITIHDMIHDRAPGAERFPAELRNRIHGAYRKADGIICISEHTKRDVVDILGIDPAKLVVIHHGSPQRIDPGAKRVVERPYILSVGLRPAYKNVDRLMQAYARLGEIQRSHMLVLFGGKPLRAAEIDLAKSLGISERLQWIPQGDDVMLANLYAHASVLAYPSFYEGFGMPLLEAFSYDCPVVSSNTSSLPEVGGDAAIYFDPTDVDQIAASITQAINNSDTRDRLIAAGHRRLTQFSWDKSARQHADFYRLIAGS